MYKYENEKPNIFLEENQIDFLKVRDRAERLLEISGAFTLEKVIKGITGSSWLMMAYVDRLVELNEIKEIPTNGFAQERIFTRE